MISNKEFEEVAQKALAQALSSMEIANAARGLISFDALRAETSYDIKEWRLLVKSELDAWDRDLQIQESIREGLLLRLNQRPATLPGRFFKWLQDAIGGKETRFKRQLAADQNYGQATSNAAETKDALVLALLERCASPALRIVLNRKLTANSESFELVRASMDGLYQQLPVGFELQTDGRRRVEHLLESMTSANIGIAGPRGSGKTTLLEWVCSRSTSQAKDIRLLVLAPAKYEARDYLLYLLITICKAVLDRAGASYVQPTQRESKDEWLGEFLRRTIFIGTIAAAGCIGLAYSEFWLLQRALPMQRSLLNALETYALLCTASFGVTVVRRVCFRPLREAMSMKRPQRVSLFNRLVRASSFSNRTIEIAIVALLVVSGYRPLPDFSIIIDFVAILGAVSLIYVFGSRSKMDGWDTRIYSKQQLRYLFGDDSLSNPVVARARETLLRASYQQARALSRSEKVGVSASLGITLSADSTSGLTETISTVPWTRPELVAEIREMLQEAATRYGGVKIAIDELDKIESSEQATAFLDDIKGVFGVPQCHFLVSVSEDALAQFERRGMPFRTSFDSAFDEIVLLTHFTLPESSRLVRSRILGTPLKFIALCHAISGGLPRDLIRSLRAVYELTLPVTLDVVASKIIGRELQSKASLMATGLGSATSRWSKLLIVWTEQLASCALSSDDLLKAAIDVFQLCTLANELDENKVESQAVGLGEEMAVFTYYCATILQLCASDPESGLQSETLASSLSELALARQGFAINSVLAWSRINSVRQDLGWQTVNLPSQS